MADVRTPTQQYATTDQQAKDAEQQIETVPTDWEERVNVAEKFYLKMTARPDVREILSRLARM